MRDETINGWFHLKLLDLVELILDMVMDESQIKWQQFISGDDDSFSWIYTAYARKLYQYGLCFTSNEELVKDSIQDIFVYLYNNRTKLGSCDNIKYYLFGAFKNNLIKAIHKESVSEGITEDVPFLIELAVEDQYIQNEQYVTESRKVEKLLSLLTSRQREIIYYRFIQGMSMEEICTLMDLNYQSAQNLIQRSLKKMRTSRIDMNLFLTIVFALQ